MSLKSAIDYCNKVMLAPMVRGSLLPMRMLALRYGADLVYTDELIDHSLLLAKRKFNDALQTFDYVNDVNGYLVFRTCLEEKNRLVFQMGTSCPERAVKLAKMVENDVSAIDINMGCPLPYSTAGGMGAALLSRPNTAKAILKSLVENINLPITCKIRVFDDIEQTVQLAKEFEEMGISAIGVHGRTPQQKHSDPANIDAIRCVAENVKIPVIANGCSSIIENRDGAIKFRDDCKASSVMIARAALQNPSIFRPDGMLPVEKVIPEYLKICIDYDNSHINMKYCIQIMHKKVKKVQKTNIGRSFNDAESLEEICDLWDLGDYAREKRKLYNEKGHKSLPLSPMTKYDEIPEEVFKLRKKLIEADNITVTNIKYKRQHFPHYELPKVVLHAYAGRNKFPMPIYETVREERLFRSICTFQNKKYTSMLWERHAKHAEQNAALVCCYHLGLTDKEFLVNMQLLFEDENSALPSEIKSC